MYDYDRNKDNLHRHFQIASLQYAEEKSKKKAAAQVFDVGESCIWLGKKDDVKRIEVSSQKQAFS